MCATQYTQKHTREHTITRTQVSLMNAPLIRMSFSVTIHSDHVALTENVNRFKVRLFLLGAKTEGPHSGCY